MVRKNAKVGLIRCLSGYKKFKDPNFVFKYFKLLLTPKAPFLAASVQFQQEKPLQSSKAGSSSFYEEDDREAETDNFNVL